MSTDTKLLGQQLLQAQQDMGTAKKNALNPHFESKFADLNEVLDVAKEALHKHGMYILQPVGRDERGDYVETRILAADGVVANSVVYLQGAGTMQQLGSAITYARRYGLQSLLALESEDDDGNTASTKPAKAEEPRKLTKAELIASIGAVSAAVVARRKATVEELQHHLTKTYKVVKKEQLEEMDALAFLAYLNGLLKKEGK